MHGHVSARGQHATLSAPRCPLSWAPGVWQRRGIRRARTSPSCTAACPREGRSPYIVSHPAALWPVSPGRGANNARARQRLPHMCGTTAALVPRPPAPRGCPAALRHYGRAGHHDRPARPHA